MTLPNIKPILVFIFSLKFFSKTIVFGGFYIIAAFVVANYSMIHSIAQLPYSFFLKTKLIGYSLWGYLHSSNNLGTTTLLLIALLFGINFALILSQNVFSAKKSRKRFLLLTSGISLFTTGCAACGIQLFSVIGITGALSILPFHGLELSFGVLLMLVLSVIINIKSLYADCAIIRS